MSESIGVIEIDGDELDIAIVVSAAVAPFEVTKGTPVVSDDTTTRPPRSMRLTTAQRIRCFFISGGHYANRTQAVDPSNRRCAPLRGGIAASDPGRSAHQGDFTV